MTVFTCCLTTEILLNHFMPSNVYMFRSVLRSSSGM